MLVPQMLQTRWIKGSYWALLKFSSLGISLLLTIVGPFSFPVLPSDDATYVKWSDGLPAVAVCDCRQTFTPRALQNEEERHRSWNRAKKACSSCACSREIPSAESFSNAQYDPFIHLAYGPTITFFWDMSLWSLYSDVSVFLWKWLLILLQKNLITVSTSSSTDMSWVYLRYVCLLSYNCLILLFHASTLCQSGIYLSS